MRFRRRLHHRQGLRAFQETRLTRDVCAVAASAGTCIARQAHAQHAAEMAQADFGEALVVIGGVEQKAYFFALDLPHSDACYVRAYPAANTEAWLDGHVLAFAFFGAVPQSVLYDNDRCLVAKIMPHGARQRAQRFSAMLSHYVIQDPYGPPR